MDFDDFGVPLYIVSVVLIIISFVIFNLFTCNGTATVNAHRYPIGSGWISARSAVVLKPFSDADATRLYNIYIYVCICYTRYVHVITRWNHFFLYLFQVFAHENHTTYLLYKHIYMYILYYPWFVFILLHIFPSYTVYNIFRRLRSPKNIVKPI